MLSLFWTFLKIGFLGFGGGYAMLSLLLEETVQFGMTLSEYADLNALNALLPGSVAINSATYVGHLYNGFLGALVTTLSVSIPSVFFTQLFMNYEQKISQNKYLYSMLSTVKIVAVGLIFSVAFSLTLSTIFNLSNLLDWRSFQFDGLSFLIMIAALYLHSKTDVSPLVLILGSGVVGWMLYYI